MFSLIESQSATDLIVARPSEIAFQVVAVRETWARPAVTTLHHGHINRLLQDAKDFEKQEV